MWLIIVKLLKTSTVLFCPYTSFAHYYFLNSVVELLKPQCARFHQLDCARRRLDDLGYARLKSRKVDCSHERSSLETNSLFTSCLVDYAGFSNAQMPDQLRKEVHC